jgi:hypothetical protein
MGMAVDCEAEKNASKVKNRETFTLAFMKTKKPSFLIMMIVLGRGTSPGLMRGREIPCAMVGMSTRMRLASGKVSSVTGLA